MQIKCPHCGNALSVPNGSEAAQGKCSGCGKRVDIQGAERLGFGPGDTLGNFRIDKLIGRGGMATVYRATQLALDRPVAVKVLHRQLARREHFLERFRREGKLLAHLSHPNIVGLVAVGSTDDGTYYLAMEYVEGETLRDRLKRDGRLPFEEAVGMVDAVAAGLEYAHDHGVLHRDIKPDNVLIGPGGAPKVADFGIARMTGAEGAAQQRLTVAKTRMGSAHYMAPEQMEDAAAVDHRADIYALGVLFYELLTGKLPIGQFESPSTMVDGAPILADRLIRHALAPSPDQRVQTVGQFRTLLQRTLEPGAPPRSHVRRHQRKKKSLASVLLAILGLVAAVVVAIVLLRGGQRDEEPVVTKPKEKSRPKPVVSAPTPKRKMPTPKPPAPKPVGKKTVPRPKAPVKMTPEVRVSATLQGKRGAKGVHPLARAFDGPMGNGRSGAVGVVVNSREPWQTTETRWLFRYARAKSAYGVQIIHPLKDGQVVIRITKNGVVAATPRAWAQIGYQRGDASRLTFTEDFKALFPLKDNQPAAFASTLRADGSYELQMNGRVVAQGVFMAASPLSFAMKAGARFPGGSSWAKRIFSGRQFPEQWEAGYAGILVEPLDSGQNTVSDLHYSPGITRLKTDENRQF